MPSGAYRRTRDGRPKGTAERCVLSFFFQEMIYFQYQSEESGGGVWHNCRLLTEFHPSFFSFALHHEWLCTKEAKPDRNKVYFSVCVNPRRLGEHSDLLEMA